VTNLPRPVMMIHQMIAVTTIEIEEILAMAEEVAEMKTRLMAKMIVTCIDVERSATARSLRRKRIEDVKEAEATFHRQAGQVTECLDLENNAVT